VLLEVDSLKAKGHSSITLMLPLQRILILETEKAVEVGRVVRFALRILNIPESVKVLQLLKPVVFISVKGVVLIAVVLKALVHIMILGRVTMKMESPVHRASCYCPKRIYKTVPIERLGYSVPWHCEQEEKDYAEQECFLHHISPRLLVIG